MSQIEIIDGSAPVGIERMEAWYRNIETEIRSGILSTDDAAYFAEYYREAGMLRAWRRPFFMRHYAEPFARAAEYLMADPGPRRKLIVDLGCGCGTQSIALALMGAKVIGLDMDRRALDILQKRKRFYEQESGRALDIEVHDGDVFKFDYAAVAPIDGVYSMFAFNMMQPTTGLLDLLGPNMATGGRFVIQDGNLHSWLARMPGRRRSVLTPHELDSELSSRGFAPGSLAGTISLPPVAWSLLPRKALAACDEILNRTWFWPISYMAMYEKQASAPAR